MHSHAAEFEPVALSVSVPPGVAGPFPLTFDVRCFVVPHVGGVTLIDAGPPGSASAIATALQRVGAEWGDITDIVITHAHFDHVGGLPDVRAKAPGATVWAGCGDLGSLVDVGPRGARVSALRDRAAVRSLRAIATAGHTPGHLSLLDEQHSILFLGDLAGIHDGRLQRAPAEFTRDARQNDRSIREVIALNPRRIVPSHGEELTEPVPALVRLLDSTTTASR